MKGVLPEIPQHILDWRKKTGADRWDEMWEGVLHMPPMPSRKHQDFEGELETWLRIYWARPKGNRVFHNVNLASIGGWPGDYRVPDLVLLTPDCFHIDYDEYFEGPPTAVVEIRSPGDESLEKLPFYAKLGVPETWVIDRDTKSPTIYRLVGDDYEPQLADTHGWIRSIATGISLRAEGEGRLAIQLTGDPGTCRLLPGP